ncbi:helix-turn-helix transcriptional regulator [Halalkalicoccus ordinarius]|uniref:helix-turn-helix transcriptional regulator n=1 Tax=Halalkalicoccus ordinarius TaxID=3116651 RepID=UPI00300F094A
MRMPVVAVWILCLLVASGATGVVSAPVAAQDGVEAEGAVGQTIEIRLQADGDAIVSVSQRFAFESEEDREAFDRLAQEFESGDADRELSATVFERIAEAASENAGREMAIEDVARESESGENAGRLELRFRWTGFAATPEDRLEVGDVFVIDGEQWLPSLSDGQRLVIHAPEEYAVDGANPDASVDNGTLIWEGPRQFEPGEPNATLVPSSRTGISVLTVGIGIALVAAIVLLVYLLSRRRTAAAGRQERGERGWEALLPTAGDGGEETSDPPESEPEPAPEPPTEPDDPFGGIDPELLSDEERVVRLLEANGGRMKQASIVAETDWSNAKVSQLLSSMADEGRIEKLRIGRENLITLVEEENGD